MIRGLTGLTLIKVKSKYRGNQALTRPSNGQSRVGYFYLVQYFSQLYLAAYGGVRL